MSGREGLRRRRLLWIGGLVLILAGLVLIGGAGWAKAHRTYTCLDSTLARLGVLQAQAPSGSLDASGLDLVEMGAQLRGLQGDLGCLRVETSELMTVAPLFGWLPGVGDDVAAAPDLLEMAQALVDAGVLLADGLAPLLEGMQARGGGQPDAGEGALDLPAVVRILKAAQPSLAAAEPELDHALELQRGLDQDALMPQVGRILDLTEHYLPLLRSGVQAAQLAPELMGAEEARTYLILAQNDDERRPTGGWISGLGLLTVEDGRVSELSFSDSWAVDNLQVPHETPPDSMLRALWAEMWLFRDANWSPDFPASARVAEGILLRDQGIAVDGVIAVDQQALLWLVEALGPLQVASHEEPVDGSNLRQFIREAWAEPQAGVSLEGEWSEWVARRKDFMSELAGAMLQTMEDQPETVDLSALMHSLWQGVEERHILVYLHDGSSADLLVSQRWDGGLVDVEGDYLQVVDANVGFNKVDPNVQREIVYRVDLSDPVEAWAEAAISYHNGSQRTLESCVQGVESLPSYEQRMHGCFWNYVRLYTEQGTQLEAAEPEPVPPGSLLSRYRFTDLGDAGPDTGPVEKGKVPYGLFFVLPPGEGREVRMAWQLAPGTVAQEGGGWRYRLLVQKQSGTPPIPLRIEVALPPEARIVSATPEPTQISGDLASYALSLAMDQEIDITFAPSTP